MQGRGRNRLSIYKEFISLKILESAQQLRAKSCCYTVGLLRRGERKDRSRKIICLEHYHKRKLQGGYLTISILHTNQCLVNKTADCLLGAGWKRKRSPKRQKSVGGKRAMSLSALVLEPCCVSGLLVSMKNVPIVSL